MKFKLNKKIVLRLVRILKWGKIAAKLAAIGTTITGAVAALTGPSVTTGVAISAAGATTYAATKGLPSNGYERTKHIPPGRVNKAANMQRKQEMELARGAKQAKEKSKAMVLGKAGKIKLPGVKEVSETSRPIGRTPSMLGMPVAPSNSHIVARKK